MNTVTQSETLALSAVAAAAAVSSAAMTGESVTVPEVAPYELHLIPLSRLRPSSRNVRQSGGTAIPELAASIARLGLLQNLTVITSPDEQWFEVVAGRRRLAALKLLVKRHKLAKDHLVSSAHKLNVPAVDPARAFSVACLHVCSPALRLQCFACDIQISLAQGRQQVAREHDALFSPFSQTLLGKEIHSTSHGLAYMTAEAL